MKKKFLSFILSLAIMLSMMPAMTFTASALNWEGIEGNSLNTDSTFGNHDGMYILLNNGGVSTGGWTGVNRTITIQSGVTVTIDMNGKYLCSTVDGPLFDVYGTLILKNAGENNSHPQQAVIERYNDQTNQCNLITIHSSGRVDILDSGEGANGIDIKNSHSDNYGGGVFVIGNEDSQTGGTFNLYDPKTAIYNCDENSGGGVFVQKYGTFNMYGGTIKDCKATGTNNGGNGGGVCNHGTFNMYGGTIKNCNAGGKNGFGGGVYNDGTFLMSGGTIQGNHAKASDTNGKGGGVDNRGQFTMSDGTILNNEANRWGGGIHNLDGTFTMTGGSVINNRVLDTVNNGGGAGVYGSNVTITNAVITGNKCEGIGIGNQIRGNENSVIKDYCTIDNGENDLSGVTNNITKSHITFDNQDGTGGTSTADATYNAAMPEVTVPTLDGYVFKGYFDATANGTKYYNADGTSAKAWDKIIANTKLYAQYREKHEHNDIDFEPWDGTPTLMPTTAGNYYLTKDITFTGSWTVPSGTTNLCMNGHVIKANGNIGNLININADATLNLYDCDNTTEHFFTEDANTGLWTLTNTETDKVIKGGVITGGTGADSNQKGGAIYSTGDLNIYGGTIAGNKANVFGGAVFLAGEGDMIVDGGAISHNYSGEQGGAIYTCGNTNILTINDGSISHNVANGIGGGICNSGMFTLNGGEIDGNKNIIKYGDLCVGGGVHNQATMNMTGGTIKDNTAKFGAGISNGYNYNLQYAAKGILNITDGTIEGNIADSDGGGVYNVYTGTTLNMSDACISGNSATNGGGVYVGSNSTFTMQSGIITGCQSTITEGNGGGIFNEGSFVMNDGIISSNKADNGGGVSVKNSGSSMIMNGGTISANAARWGGGVYNNGGTISLSSEALITYNTATCTGIDAESWGGGIYISNGNLNVTGGTISNNTADNGGGISLKYSNSIGTMSGGTISGNAAKWGGGVALKGGAKFTLKGKGIICSNNASSKGGGVYVSDDNCDFTMNIDAYTDGGTITGNTDANGGKQVYKNGGSATLKGYCTVDYDTNDLYQVTNNITKSHIIFDKQGGTGGTTSADATYNAEMPAVTIPTKTKSTFRGYFDETSGGAKYYNADGTSAKSWDKIVASTTLYAQWTEATKASAEAPTAISGLKYTGSALTLANAGSSTEGTIKYVVDQSADAPTDGWKDTIDQKTDAGTYYVHYYVSGDATHKDSEPAYITVTIGKADITPTISLQGWAYGDNPNTPEVTGNAGNGTETIKYYTNEACTSGESSVAPTALGTYWVKVTIAETDNYNIGTAKSSFTIVTTTYTVTLHENGGSCDALTSYVYATGATLPVPTKAGYIFDGWYTDAACSEGPVTAITTTDEGDKEYWAKWTEKAKASAEAPTAISGLKYTGSALTIASAGSSTEGTIKYVVDQSADAPTDGWKDTIDEKTNAGTYYVHYYVSGDAMHNDSDPAYITVEIGQADNSISNLTMADWIYGETASTPTADADFGEIIYSYSDSENGTYTDTKPSDAGSYWVKAAVTETDNYKEASAKASFTISKSTLDAPTGLTGVKPSSYGGNDGKITGTTTAMEYSTSADFSSSINCTGTETTGLLAGTYYVRYKATDNTDASEYTEVTVPTGDKTNFNIAITNYSDVYDGDSHSIALTGVPDGATVEYGETEGTYDQNSITYTNFTDGAKTVYVKVTMEGYNDFTGSGTVNITQKDVSDTRSADAQNVVCGVGTFTEPTFHDDDLNEDITGTLTYTYDSQTKTKAEIETALKALPDAATGTISWTYVASGNYKGTITGSIDFTIVDIKFTVEGETATANNAVEIKSNPTYGDTWNEIVTIKSDDITASVDGISGSGTYTLNVSGTPNAGDNQAYSVLFTGTVNGVNYTDVIVLSGTVDIASPYPGPTPGPTPVNPEPEKKQDDNSVEISLKDLKVDSATGTYTVNLDIGSLELDSRTVDSIVEQAKGDTLVLHLGNAVTEELTSAQQQTLTEYNVLNTIDAYFESDGIRIHDFNGGLVTVALKFEPEEGKKAENYKIYYLDDEGVMHKYASKLENGILTFATTHFSNFVVVYDAKIDVLLAKASSNKSSIKLSWNELDNIQRYDIYGAKCGKDYKLIKSTTGKSFTVKKLNGKKLKAHKTYKFYVVAYDAVGNKVQSRSIHYIYKNSQGKYANVKSIKAKIDELLLGIGKTHKLGATYKMYAGKKHIRKTHGVALKYTSTNPEVAKVTLNGKVTAVGKGTATIYIQDIGGKYCKTKVTVE